MLEFVTHLDFFVSHIFNIFGVFMHAVGSVRSSSGKDQIKSQYKQNPNNFGLDITSMLCFCYNVNSKDWYFVLDLVRFRTGLVI